MANEDALTRLRALVEESPYMDQFPLEELVELGLEADLPEYVDSYGYETSQNDEAVEITGQISIRRILELASTKPSRHKRFDELSIWISKDVGEYITIQFNDWSPTILAAMDFESYSHPEEVIKALEECICSIHDALSLTMVPVAKLAKKAGWSERALCLRKDGIAPKELDAWDAIKSLEGKPFMVQADGTVVLSLHDGDRLYRFEEPGFPSIAKAMYERVQAFRIKWPEGI